MPRNLKENVRHQTFHVNVIRHHSNVFFLQHWFCYVIEIVFKPFSFSFPIHPPENKGIYVVEIGRNGNSETSIQYGPITHLGTTNNRNKQTEHKIQLFRKRRKKWKNYIMLIFWTVNCVENHYFHSPKLFLQLFSPILFLNTNSRFFCSRTNFHMHHT